MLPPRVHAAVAARSSGCPLPGTAAACLVLVVSSLLAWHRPGAASRVVGGLLYLVGTMLVTIVFNVPRNDVLAAADPASAEGARVWAHYVTSWTAWNHVRTAAALGAAAALTVALWLSHPRGAA